jgi:hypothetical protein
MRQRGLFKQPPRIITHSAVGCFQECRVKWDYRYRREIVPKEPQTALGFGTAIHAGLEFWFKHGMAKGAVEAGVASGAEQGLKVEDLCKVQVLLEAYTENYKEEPFEVVEVEKTLCVGLRNPRTLKYSRTFRYMGKVDGLVKMDGGYYILEHKTASDIGQSYLDSLEIKPQTALYAAAMEETGVPVRGAIYDIIEKPGIRMGKGETEEEYEARKAALMAKSKTGKTTAQRKEAETVDDFMARLREKVTAASFRRVTISLDLERKRDALDNIWRASQDMRRPEIYPNTGNCIRFGQVCPYLNLCRKHGRIEDCPDEYGHRKANCELEGT